MKISTVINDPSRPNTEVSARFYFSQLLQGVRHLHQLGIMHRVSCFKRSISNQKEIQVLGSKAGKCACK